MGGDVESYKLTLTLITWWRLLTCLLISSSINLFQWAEIAFLRSEKCLKKKVNINIFTRY